MRLGWRVLTAKPIRPKSPTASDMIAVLVYGRVCGWVKCGGGVELQRPGVQHERAIEAYKAGDGQEEGRRSLVGVSEIM